MGLTSKETLREVQKLSDMFFKANSLADNYVYQLDVVFNMPEFTDYFHHTIAHLYPALSDKIVEFGLLRQDRFFRGSISLSDYEYLKVSDGMNEMYQYCLELEKQIDLAIDIAIEFGDKMYEDFLRSFQVDNIAILTKQLQIFYKQMVKYENTNDIHKWNSDFESYVILKQE